MPIAQSMTKGLGQKYVASLTSALKLPTSLIPRLTEHIAEAWMNYLHKLVHLPIFQARIDARNPGCEENEGVLWPNQNLDDGQVDTDLEMAIMQAMEVVTNHRALPKFPAWLTFWKPPIKRTVTEIES